MNNGGPTDRRAAPLAWVNSPTRERGLLSEATEVAILRTTREFWEEAIVAEVFQGIATGKEIGHRIADHVDDETTALLAARFNCVRQTKSDGSAMPRSMGDIWILDNGIYNPINVKSGESGKKGQPNMVSLKKLLLALLNRQIDSYYLLIIKVGLAADTPTVSVYLVDLLDWLSFATFDSGPGQIMLKEQEFYDAVDAGTRPSEATIAEKVRRLYAMLEDGDRRLAENRERKRLAFRRLVDTFPERADDPIEQAALFLK